MDFKKLIRALLQSKFGGAQLSDARVNELIEKVKDKVTTEEELEAKLEAYNEAYAFTEIAKDDDRYRTKNAELEKLKGSTKGDDKEVKAEEASAATADEMPAWAKALELLLLNKLLIISFSKARGSVRLLLTKIPSINCLAPGR